MARLSGRQFLRKYARYANAPADGEGYDEIADLAEAVAGEHCPSGPVDPGAIARAKSITTSCGDYGEAFDGMLEHREGRFHIYCNLARVVAAEAPRARFTMAHELGHYYIDSHRQALSAGRAACHMSRCEYESSLAAEQQADRFAANLLMPRERFALAARAAGPGLAGIISLAGRFRTSVTATAIRYAQVDVSPCAVVKWDRGGYAWKYLSTSAYLSSFRRTFESADDLPADCPTRLALARKEVPGEGYFEAGTTAAAWFPSISPEDGRNIIFVEQAMGLGQFGVLTFLHPVARPAGANGR